jgi:hypothetical protein
VRSAEVLGLRTVGIEIGPAGPPAYDRLTFIAGPPLGTAPFFSYNKILALRECANSLEAVGVG